MNCKCKKPNKYWDNKNERSLKVRCWNCKGLINHKGKCQMIPEDGEGVCERKVKYRIGKGKGSCVVCGTCARVYRKYLDGSKITALTGSEVKHE